VDFLCRRISGEAQAGADASELCWITARELEGFPIADSTAAVVRKGLERGA